MERMFYFISYYGVFFGIFNLSYNSDELIKDLLILIFPKKDLNVRKYIKLI